MNVLGVFAHPDDEVLGCGGTLAKHAENGDKVCVGILCQRSLDQELSAAGEALGITSSAFDYPDQRLERELVADIAQLLVQVWPNADVIYTHHPGDLNLDHALTARAVLTAFRPKPGEKPRTILACEVLSSTEYTFPQQFSPNWFEALTSEQIEKKLAAMECYPSEMKSPRDADGILSLAGYRGNQCGVNCAEAFQLLRRGPC